MGEDLPEFVRWITRHDFNSTTPILIEEDFNPRYGMPEWGDAVLCYENDGDGILLMVGRITEECVSQHLPGSVYWKVSYDRDLVERHDFKMPEPFHPKWGGPIQ